MENVGREMFSEGVSESDEEKNTCFGQFVLVWKKTCIGYVKTTARTCLGQGYVTINPL